MRIPQILSKFFDASTELSIRKPAQIERHEVCTSCETPRRNTVGTAASKSVFKTQPPGHGPKRAFPVPSME